MTRIVALAGGVGGAKLAVGLSKVLPPADLTVVGNTGDDETFFGLHVSPDLDTLMYTLAGLADPERGWGLAGETFRALGMLRRYGEPAWFNIGDQDLATHIMRTRLLREGRTLTEVTRMLAQRLGVQCVLAPMADEPVRTMVQTDQGELAFQEYFVHRRCEPRVTDVRFRGAERSRMSPAFAEALAKAQAVVYCPSNTIVSIGPFLAVPGVRDALQTFRGPRIAVSPIIGDKALRGPAAKMLEELKEDVSCVGVAKRLAGLCDVLLIDPVDAGLGGAVRRTGMDAVTRNIIMETPDDRVRLAREVMEIVQERLK